MTRNWVLISLWKNFVPVTHYNSGTNWCHHLWSGVSPRQELHVLRQVLLLHHKWHNVTRLNADALNTLSSHSFMPPIASCPPAPRHHRVCGWCISESFLRTPSRLSLPPRRPPRGGRHGAGTFPSHQLCWCSSEFIQLHVSVLPADPGRKWVTERYSTLYAYETVSYFLNHSLLCPSLRASAGMANWHLFFLFFKEFSFLLYPPVCFFFLSLNTKVWFSK